MAEGPEAKVKREIKNLLIDIGAWFYMPVQNGMGRTGIPDFVCCYEGKFLAIEAKAPGKKHTVTSNQEIEMEGIEMAGGVSVLADSAYDVTVALITAKMLPPGTGFKAATK